MNLLFTQWIPQWYGKTHSLALPGMTTPVTSDIAKLTAIWAVQAALRVGIVLVLLFDFRSEERRVGKGCFGTCISGWWPDHYKKNNIRDIRKRYRNKQKE